MNEGYIRCEGETLILCSESGKELIDSLWWSIWNTEADYKNHSSPSLLQPHAMDTRKAKSLIRLWCGFFMTKYNALFHSCPSLLNPGQKTHNGCTDKKNNEPLLIPMPLFPKIISQRPIKRNHVQEKWWNRCLIAELGAHHRRSFIRPSIHPVQETAR